MKPKLPRLVAAALLALPLLAAAQQAYTRYGVNLRAGPGGNYPLVARLGGGQPIDVVGCTRGYGWCDVGLPDGLRGWVAAGSIDYPYDGGRVPLGAYGAAIGVPIIAFGIGSYWGSYYRDRPWYGDRRWWGSRPPPPVVGWARPAYVRPGWQPNPWRGPAYAYGGPGYGGPAYVGPRPGYYGHGYRPGYAPGPGYVPRPAYAPHPGYGAYNGYRPRPGPAPGYVQAPSYNGPRQGFAPGPGFVPGPVVGQRQGFVPAPQGRAMPQGVPMQRGGGGGGGGGGPGGGGHHGPGHRGG